MTAITLEGPPVPIAPDEASEVVDDMRASQIMKNWEKPLPPQMMLEDAAPRSRDDLFQQLDDRQSTVAVRDSAPPLSDKEIEIEVSRRLASFKPDFAAKRRERTRQTVINEHISSAQIMEELAPDNARTVTNNFYIAFNPDLAEQASQGKKVNPLKELYAALPYYVNDRYDKAWLKMCQTLPREVKLLMNFAANKRAFDADPDEERRVNQALSDCTKYLYENHRISPSLLAP